MCIKQKSSFVHKNLVDAIEKGNVALVELINWIIHIEKQQVQAKKNATIITKISTMHGSYDYKEIPHATTILI